MTGYTPTTGEVEEVYATFFTRNHDAYMTGVPRAEKEAEYRAEFGRMLARVKAEAQVEVLREVADELNRLANTKSLIEAADKYAGHYAGVRAARQEAERLTRGSADRIAREAGIETKEATDD